MKKNIFFLIFVSLILAIESGGVIDTFQTQNSYCNSGGSSTWEFTKLSQTSDPVTAIDFDESSTFKDSTGGDTVLLMVKKAVGTEPFKFITLNKTSLQPVVKACQGTTIANGYTFFALIGQILFLKKSAAGSDQYYTCAFYAPDTADKFVPAEILIPGSDFPFGGVSYFFPLNVFRRGDDVFVATLVCGNSSKKAVYTYDIEFATPQPVPNLPTITRSKINPEFADSSTYFIGNGYSIYSPVKNKVLSSDSGTWIIHTEVALRYPFDYSSVKVFRLHTGRYILSFLSSPSAGNLYSISLGMITEITWTSSSTSAYVDYFDDVSNLMRFGSDNVLWLTLNPNGFTFLQSSIPAFQLDVAGDQIQEVVLSGNVATIFYGTRLKYLKHKANFNVEQLFDKTITSTNIDFTEASFQYRVKFSCICASVKRFTCFSSTLNCVIIKKAGTTCTSQGVFTNP